LENIAMSDLYLQERKLIALMAQGALEGVRFNVFVYWVRQG